MTIPDYILNKINFSILDMFDSYCWIAGGAISDALMSRYINDIDIFFPTVREKDIAKDTVLANGGTLIDTKPNGHRMILNDQKIDIIHIGRNPLETILSFDYSICCIAIDKNKQVYKLPNYDNDLKERRLTYMNNDATPGKHPVNKADRLLRYLKKGYTISNTELKNWLDQLIKDQEERVRKNEK